MNPKDITSSSVPVVIRNFLNWEILKWNRKNWSEFFENYEVSRKFFFRKGYTCCSKEPLWERSCEIIEMTFSDFFEKHFAEDNEKNKDWLYFDYKHIGELFCSEAEKLDISWGELGHPEKTAKDSTLWIGTLGAHTPCHLDTYGCNLVAQINGRKKWYLMPPSESENLKPTRVPYEESSIYSSINFSCGCSMPKINDVRMVILNPGDVLFVPHQWWHYVENLSSAISINVWLPVASDNVSRLEESLVKYFVSSICRSIEETERTKILNPNEDDLHSSKENYNLEELAWCINQCSGSEFSKGSSNKTIDILEAEATVPRISFDDFYCNLKEKCSSKENQANEPKKKNLRKDIINAFCHPDVIDLVRKKLLNSRSEIN